MIHGKMRNVEFILRTILASSEHVSDTSSLYETKRWWDSQEGERIEYFIEPMVQSLAIRKHIVEAFKSAQKYEYKKRLWEDKKNRAKVVKTTMRKLECIGLGFNLIRNNYDYALAELIIKTHGLYFMPAYDITIKMKMELKK